MRGDASYAAEMATHQRVPAGELMRAGIVHAIVPETGDAETFTASVAAAVVGRLREVAGG